VVVVVTGIVIDVFFLLPPLFLDVTVVHHCPLQQRV
jgi:hypothetical protein